MLEVEVGKVTHYFSKIGVAAIDLARPLHKGDEIHVQGHTTDMREAVGSMQIHHHGVDSAKPGDDVAIGVEGKVREGDHVYRVIPEKN